MKGCWLRPVRGRPAPSPKPSDDPPGDALRQALRRLPPDLRDQHLAACGLAAADLEADIAAVRQALGAAARGGPRAAGCAVAWGARLARRAAAWGLGQVAAAVRRRWGGDGRDG